MMTSHHPPPHILSLYRTQQFPILYKGEPTAIASFWLQPPTRGALTSQPDLLREGSVQWRPVLPTAYLEERSKMDDYLCKTCNGRLPLAESYTYMKQYFVCRYCNATIRNTYTKCLTHGKRCPKVPQSPLCNCWSIDDGRWLDYGTGLDNGKRFGC